LSRLPSFRFDLDVIPRFSLGRPGCLVRDPRTQNVFEFGAQEQFLIRLLDGVTPHEEILRRHADEFGAPLSQAHLDAFVRQLARQGLLEAEGCPRLPWRTLPEILAPEEFIVEANVSFGGGDRFLGFLAKLSGWIFSRPMQWLGAGVILFALATLFEGWPRFTSAIASKWGPQFFITMIIPSSLFLRSLRSIVQGVHCRARGGHVRAIGVTFLYYLLPSIYCDWWNDVVWIRSKSERFQRLASGLYLQALLWAVAMIGWRYSVPGTWPATLWLAATLAAALNFILANVNPLVQMEGYLILMNWLEVPRLRERANALFGAWLYLRPDPEPIRKDARRWFILYGGLAFAYVLFMIGLHLYFTWTWLTSSLQGPGAILCAAIVAYAFQKPILSYLGSLAPVRWLLDHDHPWRLRLTLVGAAAATSWALLLPYPYTTGGPMELRPVTHIDVRTDIEGLVEKVLVHEGDWVEKGQPLARLSMREKERNLESATGQLEEARAQLHLLEAGPRSEAVASARAAVRTAETASDFSRSRAARMLDLRRRNLVSPQEMENALAMRDLDGQKLEEARAHVQLVSSGARKEAVEALRAQVKSLQVVADDDATDVAHTTIASPVSGRVVTPHIDQLAGTYLEPGRRDLIAEIEDGRTVRAEVAVPEETISEVHLGAGVRLHAWAYLDRTFEGRVVSIAPVAAETDSSSPQPGKVAVRVLTEIANPEGLLKSDMTGYAKIAASRRPVWRVLFDPLVRFVMVEVWSWIP
jgi:multidrug efflux pump subunit AcrA (membrane-fusion protein)